MWLFHFCIYSTKVCPIGCDWWEVIIGLDDDLVPNRPQVIIYTNDEAMQRRIYAALGRYELLIIIIIITMLIRWLPFSIVHKIYTTQTYALQMPTPQAAYIIG